MSSTTDWGEVASIPIDKPPTHAPFGQEIPDDDDMGLNDPQNIIYINMESEGLGQRFKDRMAELEQMLQLTHQLATIHAGIQVKQRKAEGSLPEDDSEASRWKRSQYRARVLDTYFNDGIYSWMYSPHFNNVSKSIRVEKSRFHWELLATMLAGIVLPKPVGAALEAIFQGIGKTIKETNVTTERRSFWSMIQVYTYDDVRDDLRASLRNVTYTLDQSMHTVVKRKSSETSVSVDFYYGQNDFSFNESTWRRMKKDVDDYIASVGSGNITNPPTVPV